MQFLDQLTTVAKSRPRRVFLVDGLGAVLTAFMHGVVLTKYENVFGMPKTVLLPLATIACCFAAFSLINAIRIMPIWQPYLRAIAVANLTFCAVSLGLVFYFFSRLSLLGVAYFVIEIIIVVGLAWLELNVAATNQNRSSPEN